MPGGFEDTKAPTKAQGGWTWVPPAQTGYQEEGTSLLPLGRYRMPDGSQQVSFGLPQGLLDAYRSVRYGLGYEQDPNAPKGYTSFDAMNKGAFGAAGGAITGALGAGAARAIKSGMPRNVVSSGGAPEPPMKPITAYHGSPHDFDRFDMAKIGTGEGAQAYGHGLYFAESPAVARNYQETLGWRAQDVDWQDPKQAAGYWVQFYKGDKSKARDHIAKHADRVEKSNGKFYEPGELERARESLRLIDSNDPLPTAPNPGRLYKVEINARPEQFLDWDKPISQQPKALQDLVRHADLTHMKEGGRLRRMIEWWRGDAGDWKPARGGDVPEPTGNQVHSALTDFGGDSARNAAMTERLKEAGIPGIRYLDQGSRGDGQGTYNYVIFDDSLVKIAEKYGFIIPGPNGMPAVSEQDMATVQALAERENTAAP